VLSLSAALVIRQLLLTGMWLNEQNLAMLAAITGPLAIAIAACRPFSVLQVPLAATGAYLGVMVMFVQNRGAILGLGASLIGLWTIARARWRWLAATVALSATAGVLAARAGLLTRFLEIYDDGQFVGTAAERLDIWWAGLQVAAGYWLFGVGPGNFTHFLAPYLEARAINNPHNSVVEVLAETGVPGLILYTSVFVVAARELISLAREYPSDWRRNLAGGLLGACAAYLVTGFFLSNPSLVLMWVLLGVAASMQQSPVERGMSGSGA
jgi:O-antigen ligase